MSMVEGDPAAHRQRPDTDVAIVGMACLFPGAADLEHYWHNIMSGVDAITDVPPGRWDPDVFFDPAATTPDRIYCKRGGYLGDLARCNPLEYGIMPVVLEAGEPDQILTLRVAHEALADAGYATRAFNRERTEIIIGRGNYSSPAFHNLALRTLGIEQTLDVLRSLHPEYTAHEVAAIKRALLASLPRFGPDTAGSLIPNLTTGRVANRLDLMGVNFTVDAACASALIAVDLAVRDLATHRCDLALVGGVHSAMQVPFLSVFSQLGALSRQSQIRPFDEKADGLVPGEGLGVVVLKRRAEAEADGDRIYAVIKGVGTASDGRGQGLLAPRVEGEELAIRRAYELAGIAPESVELIEAHGTGTPVGDLAEIQALTRVFGPRRGPLPTCAVGSVKSMIGHLMPAAGIAGLIKAALALHHKILPPTLHCESPNPKFELDRTPFYISTTTRPWVHGDETPRRAGVNSFGFGGINAHVILEEHPVEAGAEPGGSLYWDTEVCLLQGGSRQALAEQAQRILRYLDAEPTSQLKDLACTLNTGLREGTMRLALVATSPSDLRAKLTRALDRLADPACRQIKDPTGVYFFDEPLLRGGKLAFLFPGEASQYRDMLKDLCLHFPEIRAAFDMADRAFLREGRPLLPSQSTFPPAGVSEARQAELQERLWEIGGALEAMLTANWALFSLLKSLEIRPDVLLGHSAGEYSALAAAGVLAPSPAFLSSLVALGATYDRLALEGQLPEAVLAAVGTDRGSVAPLLQPFGDDIYLAMDNCPHQVVLVGRESAVEQVLEKLRERGVICQKLPFRRAYHTPAFRSVAHMLEAALRATEVSPPRTDIYSCVTMAPYPRTPEEIRHLILELACRPVEFTGSIDVLYQAGVRVFVEVGPMGNLTGFVNDTLRGKSHLAIPCDVPRRSGTTQLNHLVGMLAAHGGSMRLDRLYERRAPTPLPLDGFDGLSSHGNGGPRPPRELPLPQNAPALRLTPEQALALRRKPAEGGVRAAHAPAATEALPLAALAPTVNSIASVPQLVAPSREEREGTSPLAAGTSAVAADIIHEHFRTMDRFLTVEQEIMEAFLTEAPATAAPSAPFAFIDSVVTLTPGQEAVVRRRLDPDEDIWLQDHCFLPRLSDLDASLKAPSVVPFTVCMEMMAEAAALLAPGKVLTGMREVQTRQWIEVEGPVSLEIVARRQPSDGSVRVEISNLAAGADSSARPPAVAEGTVMFADGYPAPVPATGLVLTSERACRHAAEGMYEEGLMFHGPRFRGVDSLDRSGENGLTGHLRVLPRADLFASTATPRLLLDPVLLDCVGQLLGYWAAERLSSGYVIFPFRVGALDIHGEAPDVSERVRCDVEIREVAPRRIQATHTVFAPDGRPWLRLSDWEDWRFFWPREFYDCSRDPKRHVLTIPWELPLARLSRPHRLACQRLESTPETDLTIVTSLMPRLILSGSELRQWKALATPRKRRSEWILGRAVAKDAVRQILKSEHGLELYPADVEIAYDEDGRPFAHIPGGRDERAMPDLSIAHSDGCAVALAGYCLDGQRLGIDLERIRRREESFLAIAFSEAERALLDGSDEWATRLWCAKEAIAKALGKGLVEGPRSLAIQAVDASTGRVKVLLGEALGRRVPALIGVPLLAYTAREGDWVVATSLCERG